MAQITYLNGDATAPFGEGNRIIVHCCNNKRIWGAGFVIALSKKWPQPEQHYRIVEDLNLGSVEVVSVNNNTYVANLIGQDGVGVTKEGLPPVQYEAIRKGFMKIVKYVEAYQLKPASIHMPRIGCGLAGGDWALIEPLINDTFIRNGLEVTVYDFPGGIPYFDSRNND